jgi:hypothetical protein
MERLAMIRDMDLIRLIMIQLEEHPEPNGPADVEIEGYSSIQIGFHLGLLKEAGFILAYDATGINGIPDFIPQRLTWNGYEFLAAAKNDNVWEDFKTMLKEKGLTVPITVAQSLLIAILKEQIDL